MNVMVVNKYKEMLMGLDIEVMKSIEGVFNVDEIIDTFSNFYYDKMILDITAIRDYQNFDNLQKLAMNINMENVILLLDDNPESDSKSYLSKLISIGIYNFTRNINGINYLLVHPHTYKDVVNIHNLSDLEASMSSNDSNASGDSYSGKLRIIGFKNMTNHAGATSLIYMLRKILSETKSVAAIEVNKVDFVYFNDKELVSTTTADLPKELMKKQLCDVVFVDLNDYPDVDICSTVFYLIEPSTIMLNRMLKKNRYVLEKLANEKVILNKCVLSSEDIATFEYETKLKVYHSLPPLDERQSDIAEIRKFLSKIGL